MRRLVPVLFVLGLLFFAACGSTADEELARELRVDGLRYVRLPDGERAFQGVVVNPTDRDAGTVQLQVALYDEDNRRVDRVLIPVREVAAHAETTFRQVYDSDQPASSIRLVGLTLP